jgi:hypothetical protein
MESGWLATGKRLGYAFCSYVQYPGVPLLRDGRKATAEKRRGAFGKNSD